MTARKQNPSNVAMSIGAVLVIVLFLLMVDEYALQPTALLPSQGLSLVDYSTQTDKAYEMYRVWVVRQHQRAFEWHARSTKVIFWVSMLVAISGISFAFWQFADASQKETKALEAEELELKTQLVSLAFKSRSVAALVMFMSIAYLLIYVILVYPVKYVPQSPMDSRQGTLTKSIEADEKAGKAKKRVDQPPVETTATAQPKETQ